MAALTRKASKLTLHKMKTTEIMARLKAKYPLENEYLQAVQEVLESIEDVYNQHP
jgi:glutamate dehydrogenase (NADP+)